MSLPPEDREPGAPMDNSKEDVGGPSCTGDYSKHDMTVCLGNGEVKSCAVVKYSAAPPPTTYALLQEKTDLKLPPANWLRENPQLGSAGTTVLGSSSKSKPFSSFGMAYDFIDCIGDDVDVVSDSENIKKLLKIPYSKSHVSMAVHRVGRTLLLDELDTQELLRRSSQMGDWTWLKEIYQRLIDQKWQRKKKSKEHWYQKAILSKFLYYSINGDGAAEPVTEDMIEEDEENGAEEYSSSWPATFTSAMSEAEEAHTPKQESVPVDRNFALGQVTSVPKEQNLPTLFNEGENSQGLRNDFVRNIMWTFEDIHMLVGSNMPIFGGGRYPAVSLRLRDSNKPINILTGIDYWLDNLMCNVPELVMCFHVNGIVQKYEMIKTEEIPHLENSTFSTRVVKDIAQNILSFLKSNCTKEGHTYWLFKASGSDIVKLYDLTTLCEEAEEEKCQNPFTLPVAVLLYRVASNLMLKASQNRKHYGKIRTLLLNCVKLLDLEKHPQIIASAYYMLSELFQLDELPDEDGGESLRAGGSEDSYSDEDREEEEGDDDDLTEDGEDMGSYGNRSRPQDDSKAVAVIRSVGELSVPEKYKSTHQIRPSCAFPVSQDKEERCRHVLSYVLKGLKAVDGSINKESDLPAADPNTPIPLKYEDGGSNGASEKGISLLLERAGAGQADQKHPTRSGMIPGSWQHRMKLQLFLKASKAYYVLSDAATNLLKYGRALRYIKLSLQCYDAYCSVSETLHSHLLQFHSQCLSLCGDIQLMLAQNASNRAAYLEEYSYQTKEDQEILHSLHRESSCQDFSMATDLAMDPEYQLFVSCRCYEAAHEMLTSEVLKDQSSDQLSQVLKRLGNIRNEMGVYYMNQAAAMQTEKQVKKSVSAAEQDLWKKSFSFFEKGMKDFEAIRDSTNTALLLCNTGRLMRICAQAHCPASADESRGEFSPDEALYYNKAVDYYLQALRALGSRKSHPAVWDSVNWELSTTYFTLATLLQDYAPLSRKAQEQIEREVTDAMMKSLKYCDLQTESARQPLYQYRAATIHHRLASMYHSCFRNQVGDEHLRKQHRNLAELHYSKAVSLFLSLKDAPCELLRTLLERVAFTEFTMTGQSSSVAKLKSLIGAIEIMSETRHAFQLIQKELLEEQEEQTEPSAAESADSPDRVGVSTSGLDLQEVLKLIGVFEPSFSFLLLQVIKLMTTTKRKPSNKDEDMLKNYKAVYSKLLRSEKDAPLLSRVELYIELLQQLTP
ncbi:erythroid differentiation-related factor 1 isoform X1 [Poecilia latipinna]|uniref:Erythroid differentiation regulatory factor 1 n=1 Tax=Poecilia latipinna TaxID=48699 RepID=A0A3B3VID4_9TELE|nr:PREDICTED: erythroid differentiation-related factor 1 isoform X1 [Poecilia latipinna]XP_014891699.1 PREDICTED: erythroid differentiation-related factor 1 isoform X1 [Poecilia latipinna]XP_014891700.1 PREDICTED: erythroid differentiation-related factor 1 isoform X1 [Poecilia latipinna]XP_014891701.1 PREDICTED: erythroid differentiation-related factor 1 isoform X1 [Poecilia latipinna]